MLRRPSASAILATAPSSHSDSLQVISINQHAVTDKTREDYMISFSYFFGDLFPPITFG